MQNRMSVSKDPHENMTLQPQQKSAWFEFVKVGIYISSPPPRPAQFSAAPNYDNG
jgi:hypothetical protein